MHQLNRPTDTRTHLHWTRLHRTPLRILAALGYLSLGYALGMPVAILVTMLYTLLFLGFSYQASRGRLGDDGWTWVKRTWIVPETIGNILPVWAGYALAAMLAVF